MSDPFAHGTPVGDHHMWVSPSSGDPCPYCECCTARLCRRAIDKDTACHWEGSQSSDYDLSKCPCWPAGSAARTALKESR